MVYSRWSLALAVLVGLVVSAAAQPPKPGTPPPAAKPAAGQPPKPGTGQPPKPTTGQPPAPKPAGTAQPPKPTPPAAPGAEVTIAWKLTKGKTFYQEMTTVTKQTMKVMGQDVIQDQNQTFFLSWTVKDITPEGNYVLVEKIEGVKLNISIGGNTINYDSTSTTPAPSNALADFFKALVGTEFTLTLDKNLKVIKVEGRDQFVHKLANANQQMEPLLKEILSEDALKQMAEPTFGVVPPTPVKPGATYTRKSKLNLGPIGSYDTTFTYTYEGKDKGLDKIKVAVVLIYAPPPAAQPGAGLPFRIKDAKLNTKEGTGEILFDSAKGRLESSTVKLVLEGNLTIEIGGQTTPVDLRQEQTTTIKTADTSFIKKP